MTPTIPLLVSLLALAPTVPQDAAKPKPKPVPVFDEAADGSAQITAALARAKRENRRVLVEWGANWCSWCRTLHTLCQNDEAIRRELLYEYDVVLVDVGRLDKHVELLSRYGVDLAKAGLPYLTILDGEGHVLANQETASLELEDKKTQAHDPKKVLDLLERHRATYLDAEKVLAAGLESARAAEKRVFVHFGAPWCGWCRRLEGWMATEEIAPILADALVDVKIDVDRTVGGKELMARLRGDDEAGIPWFAILDASGAVLAGGDVAPGKPIGFPYEPEEIEAFAAMLAKGAPGLAPDEIETLKSSLAAIKQRDDRAKSEAEPAKKSE